MSNAFVSRLETYYDLRKFDAASKKLANANGLHGVDSMLWDSSDHPLELGAAGVNAIAHALTSAYLAHDHSAAEAAILGFGREFNSYWFDNKRTPVWDTFKDLYNNQVGRNIADYVRSHNLSRDQIQDLVLDALTSGKLIVTHEDNRIDPSFDGNPENFSLPTGDAAPWTAPSAGFSEFAPLVERVPIAPPQGTSSPTPAFALDAAYSPTGDFYGNFPGVPSAGQSGSLLWRAASMNPTQAAPLLQPDAMPDAVDEPPVRRLSRSTYSLSEGSAFDTTSPSPAVQGSLSLNDAYLEYLKRSHANQAQASVLDTSTPATLVPSDDSNFSGGLLGRMAALMGVDPQNPDQLAPPPQDDALRGLYRDDSLQPWTLQRFR